MDCERCRFGVSYRDEDGVEVVSVECRRYAPRPLTILDGIEIEPDVAWPVMHPDDTCGEFEGRDD